MVYFLFLLNNFNEPQLGKGEGNMHVKEVQMKVDDWITQFESGYWPPLSMFAALVEEIGELGREINHLEGFKPKKQSKVDHSKDALGFELADLLFSIVCIANFYEIDLESYFHQIMEKYSMLKKK